jgi:hypothetical protein
VDRERHGHRRYFEVPEVQLVGHSRENSAVKNNHLILSHRYAMNIKIYININVLYLKAFPEK